MAAITSRQHPIAARFRDAARGNESQALIDGWHLLHEAAVAGLVIDLVAIVEQPHHDRDTNLLARLGRSGVTVVTVTTSVMGALSPVRAPTGVVSLIQRRDGDLARVARTLQPLVVVAVDVQDPGNTGAMVRAAEAGGATGVICAGLTADPWGWKALRAAMGSTFRLPLHRDRDVAAICQALRDRGVRVVATVPTGADPMHEVDLRRPTALLFGGEGEGIGADVLRAADSRITIPMQPAVESLNVAVATGILVYEARRQRIA